jgi:hypothetical protein
VAIEEPEHALHPGAASVLRDALRVAATQRQVLATSHSPDLLDDRAIVPESIVSVVSAGGETKAGPVNEASRGALRDGLFTVGELLRIDQLAPGNVGDSAATHSELFERLPA